MRSVILIFIMSTYVFSGTYITFYGVSHHFEKGYEYKEKKIGVNHSWDNNNNVDIFDFYTYEEKKTKKYNETHNELGVYQDISDKYSIAVSIYKNSIGNASTSIVASRKFEFENFYTSLNLCAVNGYMEDNDFIYLAYPSISKNYKLFNFELSATHEVIFLQIRFKVSP